MSAVAEIEAAIVKLTRLKGESTQPVDGQAWIRGRDSKRYEDSREVYTGPDENSPGSADIVRCHEPADAELIVTLHRTIDAQLAVLANARGGARDMDENATPDEPSSTLFALDLARAINNTA